MTESVDRLDACIAHLREALATLRDAHGCACHSNELLQILLLQRIGPMREELAALVEIREAALHSVESNG